MTTGLHDARVVQVHPTLRCNLSCPHCYSSSSPTAAGELAPRTLIRRLECLRSEGYEVVSFSGGEPLVYRGLFEVADAARDLGFRVNAISNGLRLTPERVAAMSRSFSQIGLSLDGTPARHDRMRARPGAFSLLESRLPLLREHGLKFGFAHCVTAESIEDLPWLLDYAIEQGATLLHLHPLTLVGRAARDCNPLALTPADLARAFVVVELLRVRAEDRIRIHLDVAPRREVLAQSGRYEVLAPCPDPPDRALSLSDLVNPIIIDERGVLSPLAYGMASAQHIAPSDFSAWPVAIRRYKASGAPELSRMLRSALHDVAQREDLFVDWYGTVAHHSHRVARSIGPSLPISM